MFLGSVVRRWLHARAVEPEFYIMPRSENEEIHREAEIKARTLTLGEKNELLFLCHERTFKSILVQNVARSLQHGPRWPVKCFVDELHIDPGSNCKVEILANIYACTIFVVFVDNHHFVQSHHCMEELELALELGKSIFPVFLSNLNQYPTSAGKVKTMPRRWTKKRVASLFKRLTGINGFRPYEDRDFKSWKLVRSITSQVHTGISLNPSNSQDFVDPDDFPIIAFYMLWRDMNRSPHRRELRQSIDLSQETFNLTIARQDRENTIASTATEQSMATTGDAELIHQAEVLHSQERYFQAARCLKEVLDESLLEPKHHRLIERAEMAQKAMLELLEPSPEGHGWKKQRESHGRRDTMIHYKVDEDTNSLVNRFETPIESSLLLPLISVLLESALYKDWVPDYELDGLVGKLGMAESNILKQVSRGNQVIQVQMNMPFRFANRECIQHAYAVDSIDEDEAVVIKINSVDPGTHDGIEIPLPRNGVKRVDYDACILIRSCPKDHYLLAKSKAHYPPGEKLLLITMTQQIDSHIKGLPQRTVNFFTRVVQGRIWGRLLEVAEEVRDHKRPAHEKAIEAKPELYGWVEDRIKVLFDKVESGAVEASA